MLLVEDEPELEALLTFILEGNGARIISAGSAIEALSQLEQRQPDVLVSNVRLPKEDGRWLIEQVRQLEGGGRELPAIALSSYLGEVDAYEALRAGFHYFLSKPLDPDELVQTVLKLAGRARDGKSENNT
ncbi:response regulator [Leptolyngbya sp. FACHB-671]|uniref:response regulator n=1 Tax=Leptolyngbya sp. FACHB-671 TaxID=2692812 RepID=UPI0016835590|nr:response regulator [Leptolyngbya sp. FACHB-671]